MKEAYLELLKKADEWIDAHKDEFISEIQGLARIPSVSRADLAEENAPFGPDCRKMLDFALERGKAYGFDTQDFWGYAGAISMGDTENSLGVIAHMDVVPVGEGWIYPPYGATYLPEHDALIGRGVGDNKGPGVAGLFAMRMLREFNWPLKHGIRLFLGMSEETGMQDIEALVEKGITFPKTTLVPDGGYPVNYGQKGSIKGEISALCEGNLVSFDSGSVRNIVPDKAVCVVAVSEDKVSEAFKALDDELKEKLRVEKDGENTRITSVGLAGHAAGPDSSINAIHLLTKALTVSGILSGSCKDAIKELYELTSDNHCESEGAFFEDEMSGPITLVYSVAHLVDGRLNVSLDCRYPIMCPQDWLRDTLIADWAKRGYRVDDFGMTKPFYIPKDDPRVVALQELYKEVTGRDDEPYTMGGGTYSRVFPNAITYGAGMRGGRTASGILPEGHGVGHGKDEILFLENIHYSAKMYAVALAMLDGIVD
ncbi:MAG: Sapep family Mn(2+)-dependent dipeptidase [Clostridia bacterium]|nr:Sapep family Mn(2+)-dependent dipeptidase [Clostridia bacterium]